MLSSPGQDIARRGLAWRALPWVFAVIALAASFFVAIRTPAFMGPDEAAHAYRADILTLGQLAPHRYSDSTGLASGGTVDRSLRDGFEIFFPMAFHYEHKLTQTELGPARRLRWDGRAEPTAFANTAVYGPVFYLPATEGLAVGKVLSLRVVDTLTLARVLGGLSCALLGFLALRAAGVSRALMAMLLLLPMSTFLFGMIDQDGPAIAATALGAALMTRGARESRPLTRSELWSAAAAFACVGMAKVPYVLFSLALLWVDGPSRRERWAAALISFGAALSWTIWAQVAVATPSATRSDVVPGLQVQYLLHHLGEVPALALRTLQLRGSTTFFQFIGQLGWIDTPLSGFFYPLATIFLALAVAVAWRLRSRAESPWARLPLAVVVIALVVTAGVYLALYLIWTPVGDIVVEGVQGRYLIPVAVFLCAALDAGGGRVAVTVQRRFEGFGFGLFLTLGLVGLAVTVRAISVRYYG